MTERPTGSATGGSTSVMSGLGRGGALNLAAAVCQQVCLLATTALIARLEGRHGLGQYVLCYAVLILVSLLAQAGLRATVTRYVAVNLADDDSQAVRASVRFALQISGAVAVAAAGAVALASPLLARGFGEPGLVRGLLLVAAAIPAFTLRDVMLAAIQGWRTQRAFAVVGWIVEPVGRFALTAALLLGGLGLDGAYVALVTASWATTVAAAVLLRRRLNRLPSRPGGTPAVGAAVIDRRAMLGFSVVSWGNSLSATGLIWADTLLLGALGSADQVGVYQVATRIIGLAIFVAAPVDALFAPHFAHLSHVADRAGLRRVFTSATTWTLRLSLPAFIVLMVFPAPLLSVFGPGFAAGALVTVVLAVGQLVNAATGPAGSLLTMGGRLRLNLADNAANLLFNIALNLVLIPPLGLLGAGLAWSASLTAVNVVKMAQIQHLMRLHPYGSGTGRALLSAVAGFGAAVVARVALGNDPLALCVGTALAALLYLATTAALGLTEDEQETLRGLLPARLVRSVP